MYMIHEIHYSSGTALKAIKFHDLVAVEISDYDYILTISINIHREYNLRYNLKELYGKKAIDIMTTVIHMIEDRKNSFDILDRDYIVKYVNKKMESDKVVCT